MKRGFWYKFITNYCPVCGHEDTWKERVYNKQKPKRQEKRHIWHEVWDYCGY